MAFPCYVWTSLVLAHVFDVSNALEFIPTPTWATLQTSALGLDILPTITAGTFQGDLKGRDASQQNSICGWIGGNGASAVSCGSDFYCATESSFVGCCAKTSCAGIVTTCYDLLGAICDAPCQHDIGNLVCSSTLPYCATYNYEGGSVGYGCAVARGYTVSVLLSTTTSDGGQLSVTSITPSATTSSPKVPPTSTLPSASTTAVSTGSKSGLGSGTIAGIVIGSIAVVALIAFLIFLVLRTRRKHREEIQALQQQQNPYPLQDRSSYRSTPYSGTTAGYYNQNKEGFIPGSPPLTEPLTPPRNSHPLDYAGPTIPELHGRGY